MTQKNVPTLDELAWQTHAPQWLQKVTKEYDEAKVVLIRGKFREVLGDQSKPAKMEPEPRLESLYTVR